MKRPPLAGIRVIEHGQALAVPYGARVLADLGAEVIKVEPAIRLDQHRTIWYPDNDPGEQYWDRGGTFNTENRGKLGITLDLRNPAAIDVMRDLVRVSDIFMQNFRTRVMQAFGLTYEALRQIKPDLIMLSSTAYGEMGSWANFGGGGPHTEAASGLAATTGYEDGPPVLNDIPYTDYTAGDQGVMAILLALHRRDRTGRGAEINLSQSEAQACLAGELFLDAAASGTEVVRHGNRHPVMAPHEFFPCAGNDRWIAIAVSSDTEWGGLQAAMENPAWAADQRFANLGGRQAGLDELNRHLADWTRGRDAMDLMHLLQSHGVPAGAALDGRDLVTNKHLHARGFFEWVHHPAGTDMEDKPYAGMPWRFSESGRGISTSAPGLGAHNQHVLHEILGYSSDKVAEIVSSGALGGPPNEFPRPAPMPLDMLMRQGSILEMDPAYQQRILEAKPAPSR